MRSHRTPCRLLLTLNTTLINSQVRKPTLLPSLIAVPCDLIDYNTLPWTCMRFHKHYCAFFDSRALLANSHHLPCDLIESNPLRHVTCTDFSCPRVASYHSLSCVCLTFVDSNTLSKFDLLAAVFDFHSCLFSQGLKFFELFYYSFLQFCLFLDIYINRCELVLNYTFQMN